jgi:hypothetical protein
MTSSQAQEQRRENGKKYYYSHLEEMRSKGREYYRLNKERLVCLNKNSKLRRRYGITLDQYTQMLEAQNGACAVCFTKDPGAKGWHVDHCHSTGKVRGILCCGCNSAAGHTGDSPDRLRVLADYLEVRNVCID